MTDLPLPTTLAPGALARLRERFEACARSGEPMACLELAVDRLERCKDDAIRAELTRALHDLVGGHAELQHALIEHGHGVTWLLVPGRGAKEVTALARSLVESARKLRVGAQRFTLSAGVAAARHGLRFEVLLAVAEQGLTVARNGGGDRAVHTDLYELLQRKLTGHGLPTLKEITPAERLALRQVDVPSTPRPAPAVAVRPDEPATEASSDERVDLLERRIAKLMRELEHAEHRIAELQDEVPSHGIASIYREVQGLSPHERLFDQKRQLMARIFEANLALRARAAG